VTVAGAAGELRCGYQQAVQLGAWQLVPSGRQHLTLTARVVHAHALWSTRTPLDLSLTLGTTEWFWEAVAPVYVGEEVVVELSTRPRVVQFARGKR
jgi:hypothetical protein